VTDVSVLKKSGKTKYKARRGGTGFCHEGERAFERCCEVVISTREFSKHKETLSRQLVSKSYLERVEVR
jgi:hypothetical protein